MTSGRTCACSRPLAPGAELCTPCTGATAGGLYASPRLLRELDTTTSRQTAKGDGGGGGARLDFHEQAAAAADLLRTVLRRYVAEWGRATRIRADQAAEVIRYMSSDAGRAGLLVTGLQSRPWAQNLHDDLLPAIDDGDKWIDRPPSSTFAGWCACGRSLYAREGRDFAVCAGCGEATDVSGGRLAMLARLPELGQHLLTVPDLALLCGIPQGTLRRWRAEHRIVPAAVNPKGQPLYPAAPVIEAALRGLPPDRILLTDERHAS